MSLTPHHPPDGSSPASAVRDSLAHSNRAVFERADVVAEYSDVHSLRPAERVILDRYRADFDGKDVLDLGVGAGRTAVWLAPHALQYVGVDYSPRMVEECRQRFPRWRFECRDARDLTAFGTASFDFVFFSYNGIDYVDHEDRQKILAEVARVLRPGGAFAFSSHNLEVDAQVGWRWASVFRRRSPAELVQTLGRVRRSIGGRLRHSGKQLRADRYAILNDAAHQFGLQTYYVTAAEQASQLKEAGLDGLLEVFGEDGFPLTSSRAKEFLHYVIRKQ